jgi:alpha-D-ribose 1-methylphosphonate 5-triphosphate diphosphatase
MSELVFGNGRIVTADAVIEGAVKVTNGRIAAVDGGRADVVSVDLGGDYLLPGLVELHTDNLENHVQPRPGVRWPMLSAIIDHDARIAGAGITTVLDAISIGSIRDTGIRVELMRDMIAGLATTRDRGMLRAEHMLHLRCEVSTPDLILQFEPVIDTPFLRLVSVMDHTPGQRQFVNLDKHHEYYKGKYGMSDAEIAEFHVQKKAQQERWSAPNRAKVVALCHERGIPLASHDDATPEHVAEAIEDRMVIAEFPTTVDAAAASHAAGLRVLMGGPNVVRGFSHSGNVSALDLARRGHLDIVSSDYVPSSLLGSVFALAKGELGISLPAAVAMASKTPAEAVGLSDRGEIAPGRRADLIQVSLVEGVPVVRGVWREGARVA